MDSTTYPKKLSPPSRPSCPPGVVVAFVFVVTAAEEEGEDCSDIFLCCSNFILPPATPLTYRLLVSTVMHSSAISAILGVLLSEEMMVHNPWSVVMTAGCIGSIAAASTLDRRRVSVLFVVMGLADWGGVSLG